jgi:hypothetical protein
MSAVELAPKGVGGDMDMDVAAVDVAAVIQPANGTQAASGSSKEEVEVDFAKISIKEALLLLNVS